MLEETLMDKIEDLAKQGKFTTRQIARRCGYEGLYPVQFTHSYLSIIREKGREYRPVSVEINGEKRNVVKPVNGRDWTKEDALEVSGREKMYVGGRGRNWAKFVINQAKENPKIREILYGEVEMVSRVLGSLLLPISEQTKRHLLDESYEALNNENKQLEAGQESAQRSSK